jgi:hypothetical protein
MLYELGKARLGSKKAICMFCGKPVGWADYFCLCKEHGIKFYKIPKVLRLLLPKFIIKIFIMNQARFVEKYSLKIKLKTKKQLLGSKELLKQLQNKDKIERELK